MKLRAAKDRTRCNCRARRGHRRPRRNVAESDRAAVAAWLATRAGVTDARVGPLVNAWL